MFYFNKIQILNSYKTKNTLLLLFFVVCLRSYSQQDTTTFVKFDFNDHILKENDNKISLRSEGVTLTYDRFGNERSAVYTHGHGTSYLNLGTDTFYKYPDITISIWVNIERRVYAGKGFDGNPVLVLKNSDRNDFYIAYELFYDCSNGRFGACSTKDSTQEVLIYANDKMQFNKWYHLVMVCNNNSLAFYVNGILQSRSIKTFETKFLKTDSLVIGHAANKKNERYTLGIFDDIEIFRRSLSEKEITDLYNTPNPNRLNNILQACAKYGIIILILVLIIFALIIRNKRNLKKQKEQFELLNKISELELKVVKAQMNPHFISNCLAAIQELIYKNDVDNAGQYLAKFSYFLRQVLNYSDKNYITINQELEIIKLNVELEQLRFKNKFTFKISLDESIDSDEVLVPALITQPFIENAIWHGLLPLNQDLQPELTINILSENNFPIIEIVDNGVGRDLDTLNNSNSKGTKLAKDKIESLNRLSETSNYKIEIFDLLDKNTKPMGTKIRIQLDSIKE